MYSFNNFEGCLCHCPMPPPSATAQPIPSFFVDFLHRFHQMLSEYSAELSRWSGGMRFCPQQQTLYGRKFAAAPPPATKVRRSLRTEKEKGSSPRGRIGHSGPRKVRILLLNEKDEQKVTLLEKEKDLHGVQGPYFISDGTQQNASPDTEQRRPSRRRAAAVQPPLSISDRLRRTLAPEHLANAANVQMPLEMLDKRPRKVRILLLNEKDEQKVTSLEKEKDLHGVQGPYFVSDGTQQNASPDTEQRRPSRRRAAAVQPPLSISDRLRRTLAPEHLANAANVQMPLEMLEQTVVETLPESITESGNYSDLLCQYLAGFEHELGNELDIGCWTDSQMEKESTEMQTNSTPAGNGTTELSKCNEYTVQDPSDSVHFVDAEEDVRQHQLELEIIGWHNECGDRHGHEGRAQGMECSPSSSAVVVDPNHEDELIARRCLPRREYGAVQATAHTVIGGSTVEAIAGCGRKRQRSSSPPSTKRANAEECRIYTERTERRVIIDTDNESAASPNFVASPSKTLLHERSVVEGNAAIMSGTPMRFGDSLTHLQLNNQPNRTPQKCYDCSSPTSSLQVLEHGRVQFRTPPSGQKTPTKKRNRTPINKHCHFAGVESCSKTPSSCSTGTPSMISPKLLSTRRMYCNLPSARRPRRIAPQKEVCEENTKMIDEERAGDGVKEDDDFGEMSRWGGSERMEIVAEPSSECKGGERSNSSQRSMRQNTTMNEDGGDASNGGITLFSELDHELIGQVLNIIHSREPG
uniref:RRM domain-containing protein n=1 Tax=Globodera pallida TaxID=36090 RepID=A0A183C2N5_GLOPA